MPATTFSIAAGTDDQMVYRTGATYPPTGAITRNVNLDMDVDRSLRGDGNFWISNILLRFDTSSLPDNETIRSAVLRVHPSLVLDQGDNRDLTADYYAWTGSSDTDYSEIAQTNAITAIDLTNIASGKDNDLSLENIGTGINRTGLTRLRLHVSGGKPTAHNLLRLVKFEDNSALRPRLIVAYGNSVLPAPGTPVATPGNNRVMLVYRWWCGFKWNRGATL